MVEGHTDDVPISGTLPSGAKDNWDFSVLRSTSVIKYITKNSTIDPIGSPPPVAGLTFLSTLLKPPKQEKRTAERRLSFHRSWMNC